MQSHGITLAFHREMADLSRELVGPDITVAVTLERYPRFIKGGFQDYKGLGCDRQAAGAKACRKACAPQESKDLALKESAPEYLRPA